MAHSRDAPWHDAIYYDFNYFMTSALKDAIDRTNRLASLDRLLRLPLALSLKNTISLVDLLSHVSGVFATIISLIYSIGYVATLAIIAILVAVPIWFLSTALASFFGGNAPLTGLCVAVLGIGFFATIRKLGHERDILIVFRHAAQEISTAYDCVKFKDKNEFLLATETLGSDLCQDIDDRAKEILIRLRGIDELHERAKERFTEILIDVVANRADRIPGFERVNEVQLRDYLRQALHEEKQSTISQLTSH